MLFMTFLGFKPLKTVAYHQETDVQTMLYGKIKVTRLHQYMN